MPDTRFRDLLPAQDTEEEHPLLLSPPSSRFLRVLAPNVLMLYTTVKVQALSTVYSNELHEFRFLEMWTKEPQRNYFLGETGAGRGLVCCNCSHFSLVSRAVPTSQLM